MRKTLFVSLIIVALLAALPAMAAGDPAVTLDSPASAITGLEPAAAPEQQGGQEQPAHVKPEKEGGLPQLKIETYPSQIFWLLLAFAVMYIAFSRSILPAIGGVIETRDKQINTDLAQAQAFKDQAEKAIQAYEKNLEQARLDATKMIQDIDLAAKTRAAQQTEEFRKKSEHSITEAEHTLNAQVSKAMSEMTGIATEISTLAAQKITGVNADAQKARAIVESITEKAKAA